MAMTRAYNVVDADGHILEPLNLWDDYIDPAFRERRPRFVVDDNGKERLTVEGKLLGNPRGIGSLGSVGVRQGEVTLDSLKYADGRKSGFHEQKNEAIARRGLPQGPDVEIFGRFERILEANPAGADHQVGSSVTYAGRSLFQLAEGLRVSSRVLGRVGEVTAPDGPAQGGGGTTAPEGIFGERTACNVQGDRSLRRYLELDG
jgi:hypothetical protein